MDCFHKRRMGTRPHIQFWLSPQLGKCLDCLHICRKCAEPFGLWLRFTIFLYKKCLSSTFASLFLLPTVLFVHSRISHKHNISQWFGEKLRVSKEYFTENKQQGLKILQSTKVFYWRERIPSFLHRRLVLKN